MKLEIGIRKVEIDLSPQSSRHASESWHPVPTETSLDASFRKHDGKIVSFSKEKINSSKGFTLIELLVVIVIISIVAAFAVLSININQNRRLETLSDQIINMISLAEQEAILRPATLGFLITSTSFQFYEFRPVKSPKHNPWIPLTNSSLGKHAIPSGVNLTLKIQEKAVMSSQPQLIISESGDLTPFVILIGNKDSAPRFKITGDTAGNLKKEIIHEE